MVKSNYVRGFAAETRCKNELLNAGYWAERFYASKGTFDVVAVNPGCVVRLIQVKRRKRNVASSEAIVTEYAEDIEIMQRCPGLPAVSRELWIWVDQQFKMCHQKRKLVQTAGWLKFRVEDDNIVRLGGD